jgi:hypothetical protein
VSQDARQRTKTYIETYDTPANITKDDGTTEASYIVQFEKPPYPLKKVFFDPKNVDGIYTISTPTSEALVDWKKEPYAYTETCPIEISATSKQGITGDKFRWKLEAELRLITETYPNVAGTYCIRSLERMTPQDRDMGLWKLHTIRYNLRYKRANDDYTSDVALSYGNGWQYDGDRVSGGPEGNIGDGAAAVSSDGGSTITQSVTTNQGSLTLNLTNFVGDAYTTNATNLGLNTTLYAKIRFRYRTTGNATAKVIATDEGAYSQTILAETASSDWAVVEATLTPAKTVDHIHFYCCDGVGTVEYDFVQVYVDDFTFPNVVTLDFAPPSRNIRLGVPSRVPSITQNLGAEPATVDMTCDLDMETSTYDWTRAAAKTVSGNADSDKGEVFLEVVHNQSQDEPWQWLSFGNKAFKVTLDKPRSSHGLDDLVTLHFEEHSNANKADDSYDERFNL